MLNKIINFSVNNKLYIILMTIGLIIFGIYEFKKLPIDAVPDITNNQIQVITVSASFGATDIERMITIPVEQANGNIPGLKEIRSISKFGLSVVTIVFEDNIDIYWARQQVNEKLISLKEIIPITMGVPYMSPISTGLGEIYQYILRPKKGFEDKYNITELRTIQDWIVRKELLRVKGVAEVSSFGGKLKQYEVSIDNNRLKASNINLADLLTAIETNNSNSGGTYIEKNSKAYFIRTEGIITNENELGNITIKFSQNGLPIKIRDVADIKIGHAVRFGAMTYNGEREVAGGVLMMLKGGNSNEVILNVKEKVAEIQKQLPEGVVLEAFLDRSKMVNNSISTLETNLLEGAIIVIFVLVIFIGNFRAGLIVASVIPLSLLFAIILMNLFGVSGNLMSLGALDFGLIIDGAVIIVESILHKFTHSHTYRKVNNITQDELNNEVIRSSSKMMNSAVFGQIIILIVYLPIFSLEGIEGKMFKPMAQTVTFALLGAFLLSLTYIPMMSSIFLSKKMTHKKNLSDKFLEKIELYYQKVLKFTFRIPKQIIVFCVILFITSIFILFKMGGVFIPVLEEGDFALDVRVLNGSSLSTSVECVLKSEKTLLNKFPEIEKIVGKTGSGEIPTDPMPIEATDMMVILKDKKEWTSAKTFDELATKMQTELDKIPGVSYGFQFPVQMRFNELMTGARQDVVCKIFGEDMDTLNNYANQLSRIIENIEGAKDLFIESVIGQPQIIIKINRDAISLYHLNIDDVNQLINASFAGHIVGNVFEGEKKFDIAVRLDENIRNNIESLENLQIPINDGNTISLKQVANISVMESYNQIQREDTKRRIIVGFNVRGRDVESIVHELQAKVDKSLKLPKLYTIKYGGSFENLEAAKARLSFALPLALVLIYLLLYIAFNSLTKSLLIYTAVPLSLIGGVFALFSRGMPFSISAGIGFIALFGVAVLNGIVLIAEFDRLEKTGMNNKKRIAIMGTKVRMRPVLMTAAVASLGFLPMAISNGAGAEVQRPLATVVIGGLVVSTFLTLFILPILYINLDRILNAFRLNKSIVTTLVIVSLFSFNSNAQIIENRTNVLGFESALDSIKKNNLEIKTDDLEVSYFKKLTDTYLDIPKTEVNYEFGQMNSIYQDSRISITQSIEFPTVYSSKKNISQLDFEKKRLEADYKFNLIKLHLNDLFNNYKIINQKMKLYESFDSSFTNLSEISSNRFKLGDINQLELLNIKNIQLSHRNEIEILKNEMNLISLQISKLLNLNQNYNLDIDNWVKNYNLNNDNSNSLVQTTSLLKIYAKEIELNQGQKDLEYNKLLPSLSLSYNNMTMFGTGADNKLYNFTQRFQSFQVGFNLPIYWGNNLDIIESIEAKNDFANQKYNAEKQSIYNKIMQLKEKNQFLKKAIESNQEIIRNSEIIKNTAFISYNKGEIDYFELISIINQNITYYIKQYDLEYQYLESIYNLDFLQN